MASFLKIDVLNWINLDHIKGVYLSLSGDVVISILGREDGLVLDSEQHEAQIDSLLKYLDGNSINNE